MHWCTVCGRAAPDHAESCQGACEFDHFPPLCCPGCHCESFEEAHAAASGEGSDR